MNPSNDPLAQLYDIEGLDTISWWPPALGWWIVAILLLLMVIGLSILFWRKYRFARSWQNIALKQLAEIQQYQSTQKQAIELSELIRRIAIRQYSRKDCAGLEGHLWLDWLSANDPAKFDWQNKAVWLINAPYAPSSHLEDISSTDVAAVVQAIRGWIK